MNNPTFEDLSEVIPEKNLPWILRKSSDSFIQSHIFRHFYDKGYIVLRRFIPDEIIDRYCEAFIRDKGSKPSPVLNGKWRHDVPYMDVKEIRDICLYPNLSYYLDEIIGQKMGLHLNLMEWTSTERNWHQDDYLNPDFINNHYLAVWFALDDIHPDSGPFECIPGSHHWPILRRHKVFAHATPEMRANPRWDSDWPWITEEFVTRAMETKIQESGIKPYSFIAEKGDVLIWSGSLVHRGSAPKVRGMERRALIAHYSSIKHRKDMPNIAYHNMVPYFAL